MKDYFRLLTRALPFTVGVALSLIGLCFLVKFYDYGLDFEYRYVWIFAIFFGVGFPTLVYGMNKLAVEAQQGS